MQTKTFIGYLYSFFVIVAGCVFFLVNYLSVHILIRFFLSLLLCSPHLTINLTLKFQKIT